MRREISLLYGLIVIICWHNLRFQSPARSLYPNIPNVKSTEDDYQQWATYAYEEHAKHENRKLIRGRDTKTNSGRPACVITRGIVSIFRLTKGKYDRIYIQRLEHRSTKVCSQQPILTDTCKRQIAL